MKKKILVEQGIFAKLKNVFFGGKEAASVSKPVVTMVKDMKPYLGEILAAKPTIIMTSKTAKAFGGAVSKLKSARKLIGETWTVTRDNMLGRVYNDLEYVIRDLSKSDNSVINLNAQINNLKEAERRLLNASEAIPWRAAKKGTSEHAKLVAHTKGCADWISSAKAELEDVVLTAAANMLKSK